MPCFRENEAVARFRPLENVDRFFREAKTRHDVRHEAEPAAEYSAHFFSPSGWSMTLSTAVAWV